MTFEEKQIIGFTVGGKIKFGVIDIVKENSLWVCQIIYRGGYVCQHTDVITNYGLISVDEFRDKFPEHNI